MIAAATTARTTHTIGDMPCSDALSLSGAALEAEDEDGLALDADADAAGALGSLPGTLLAELSVIAVQYFYLRRELPYKTYFRTCAIFPIAGLLMFFSARGVKLLCTELLTITSPLLLLAAEVAVGAVVYLGITGGWYYRFRRETLKKLIRK
jgi:hypothetical protein